MKSLQKHNNRRKNAAITVCGILAGALNGFLGSGGGIVLLYVFGKTGGRGENSGRDSFASVVAAVLPLSAVSAVIYSSRGMGNISELYRYILPAAAGGMLGAFLTDKLNGALLRKIFAVVLIIAGINMLF